MAEYVQEINNGFIISSDDNKYCGRECKSAHTILSLYFDNPVMYKTKNTPSSSVYMVNLKGFPTRYIVGITPIDPHPAGTGIHLSSLPWIVFQTRTLDEDHSVPTHSYSIKREPPYDSPIIRVERTKDYSRYSCEGVYIDISLLYSKNQSYDYSDKGCLYASLENYNTIIRIKDGA
jgi:hypothetical protein